MNIRAWILPPLLAALLSLPACVSVAPRPAALPGGALSAPVRQAEAERQQWLLAHPDWSFQGRAAISKGSHGGSGRVDWQQRGRDYAIQLSAPVTRQSWRLSGEGATGHARLDGVEGGPRASDDAQQLLREATGWEIPVEGLPAWVRGQIDPTQSGLVFDAEGRPSTLQQQGWRIDYLDWFPAQAGRPALPKRIEARSGDAKVRLLLDEWDFLGP